MAEMRVSVVREASVTKSTVKMCIYTLSVIGCIFHITFSSFEYFKYRTEPRYAPYIPSEQTMPFVSFCVEKSETTDNSDQCTSKLIDPSSVLRQCASRNFTSRKIETVDCSSYFIVNQSIDTSAHTCWTVKVKHDHQYNILEAIGVRAGTRILYVLNLTRQFEEQSEMKFMQHFGSNPLGDYHSIPNTFISRGSNNASVSMSLLMAYRIFESFALPSPYDTECVDESVCSDSCGRRHAWCKNLMCAQKRTITYADNMKKSVDGISLIVSTIGSPSTRVTYAPQEQPSAFILRMCSLLGIWLGLSVHFITQFIFKFLTRKPNPPARRLVETLNWRNKITDLSRRVGVDMSVFNPIIARKLTESRGGNGDWAKFAKKTGKLVIIGIFLRELSLISMDYFKYEIRVNSNLKMDAKTQYPSISHCIDINQWFNRTQPTPTYRTYDEEMTAFSASFQLTLKELFDSTLDASLAIKKCKVRRSTSSSREEFTDCSKFFETNKFYFGEFICYFFKPTVKFIPQSEMQGNSSVLLSIVLHDRLAAINHYQTIVSDGLPDEISRYLVSESWKQTKNEKVELDYSLAEYSLLPKPYETRCLPYNRINCKTDCWELRKIGFAPRSIIIEEKLDIPIIRYVDMKNESRMNLIEEYEKKCETRGRCPSPCQDSFSKTHKKIKVTNESLELTLVPSKYPTFTFHVVPVYTVYEFIYQMICSASFWIGLSLTGFLDSLSKLIICSRVTGRKMSRSQLYRRVLDGLEEEVRIKFAEKYKRIKKSIIKNVKTILRGKIKLLIYFSLLTLGFCGHCFIVSKEFLSYPTKMDTVATMTLNYTGLRGVVCMSINELDLSHEYALSDVWEESPRADQLIVECGYRGADLATLSRLPRNLKRRLMPFVNSTGICNTGLRVKKFITLGLVCYQIEPAQGVVDPEFKSDLQIGWPRFFAYYILSPAVSRFNLTVAVSTGSSTSSLLMPNPIVSTQPTAFNQYYFVSFIKFIISSLPYPYEMGIYDSLKRLKCLRICVGRAMEKERYFSSYGRADSPTFRLYQTKTETRVKYLKQSRDRCERECKFEKHLETSSEEYFDSYAEGPYTSIYFPHLNGTIALWYCTSDHFETTTKFLPKFRLVDLVLYVGSIFAIWFGLSAVQLVDLPFTQHRDQVSEEKMLLSRLNKINKLISS